MIDEWWGGVPGTTVRVLPFVARSRSSEQVRNTPQIRHVEIPYRRWDGPIGPWAEHFGKGRQQVYPLDGGPPERSCNEVEVAKLLRKVRDEAFWVSSYNPTMIPQLWRPWVIAPKEMPDWLKEFDHSLRRSMVSPRGGIPDVVAWDDVGSLESAVFVECKAPKEKVKESQKDWTSAAIEEGVSPSRLAVALRVFRP